MSSSQNLAVSGGDTTNGGRHGSSHAPLEDARILLKPTTPTRKPTPPKPENAITIAVSSRVLFNMEKEQRIYEEHGMEEYIKYQVEHETEPFSPGPAFSFVKALEAVNTQLRELYPDSEELFDVVLMTNNHAHVGLRLINTINHHQLFIERFCMTGGNSPIGYLKAYHTNLYLSADSSKVREALVTARSAASSGARALKTLRLWGLEIDEALFLAGAPKGPMLEKIRPHIFFDDQMFHVEGAAEMGTVACHVPSGLQKSHCTPSSHPSSISNGSR